MSKAIGRGLPTRSVIESVADDQPACEREQEAITQPVTKFSHRKDDTPSMNDNPHGSADAAVQEANEKAKSQEAQASTTDGPEVQEGSELTEEDEMDAMKPDETPQESVEEDAQ